MAITSVDVDRDIIREIKKLTGKKTDREVINDALLKDLAFARQHEFFARLAETEFSADQLNAEPIDYPL